MINLFLSKYVIFDKLILNEKNVWFIERLKKFVLSISFFLFIKTIRYSRIDKWISTSYFVSNIYFIIKLIQKLLNNRLSNRFENVASKFSIKIVSNYNDLIENESHFDNFDIFKNILNVKSKISLFFDIKYRVSFFL